MGNMIGVFKKGFRKNVFSFLSEYGRKSSSSAVILSSLSVFKGPSL